MNPHFNNAGVFFATKKQIAPAVYTPATTDGAGIDRLAFGNPQSCKMVAQTGAVTGSTADVKLQDSADNSSFADYIPPRGPTGVTPGVAGDGALTQLTAATTLVEKNVDLSSARRYIRMRSVVAGGTSLALSAEIILCGGDTNPQP